MDVERLLDHILIPRPNGSTGLFETASFIEASLRQFTPYVELHTFSATPWGFQLLFVVALILMLGVAAAILLERYRFALLLIALAGILLLVETELLWSPVSGLLRLSERNVVGVFPGVEGAPTLILSAHYDTATQFGDHFAWNHWGPAMGPAAAGAAILAIAGLRRRGRGKRVSRRVAIPVLALSLAPFGVMAWFFSAGPLLQVASPGALDNGGSVAVLLRLAERVASRSPDAPTTVKLVFFAAEEERALGSWRYAEAIDPATRVAVINLETLGTSEPIGYVPEEGFQLRRYGPSADLLDLADEVARATSGRPIQPVTVPRACVTDARSFLERGIPALTLMGPSQGALPRHLHSHRDDESRLSLRALEEAVAFLEALIIRIDRNPEVFSAQRAAQQAAEADGRGLRLNGRRSSTRGVVALRAAAA